MTLNEVKARMMQDPEFYREWEAGIRRDERERAVKDFTGHPSDSHITNYLGRTNDTGRSGSSVREDHRLVQGMYPDCPGKEDE